MSKIIKVESCAECDYTYKNCVIGPKTGLFNHYCKKTHKSINNQIKDKTIHPDCPLDSEEKLIDDYLASHSRAVEDVLADLKDKEVVDES